MSEITHQDVLSLHEDSSPEKRAILAQKIGYGLQHGNLSDTERELALAICQQLAKDIDVTVRTCLSDHLKQCPDLPAELAYKIADDVLIVSLPFLEVSSVLNDADLIEISKSGGEPRQLAISRRENLGHAVAHTLAEIGNEIVVNSLVRNESADLKDQTLEIVLNRFSESERIHTGIAHRAELSSHILNIMIDLVTDDLKTYLATHHDLSAIQAEKVTLMTREDTKNRLMDNPQSMRDTAKLVKNLDHKGKLTHDLIFRALEIGDRSFFEHAMAFKVGIPVDNARRLIRDEGSKGFAALYKKAKMPKEEFDAIHFMVTTEYHSTRTKAITDTGFNTIKPQNWVSETDLPADKSKFN